MVLAGRGESCTAAVSSAQPETIIPAAKAQPTSIGRLGRRRLATREFEVRSFRIACLSLGAPWPMAERTRVRTETTRDVTRGEPVRTKHAGQFAVIVKVWLALPPAFVARNWTRWVPRFGTVPETVAVPSP